MELINFDSEIRKFQKVNCRSQDTLKPMLHEQILKVIRRHIVESSLCHRIDQIDSQKSAVFPVKATIEAEAQSKYHQNMPNLTFNSIR
jgi:putative lipoic acid-binding regulatory protein